MQNGPSSNVMMFQAVLWWIIAWWLIELANGEPMPIAVGVSVAFIGLGLSIGSVTSHVPQPSPWGSVAGRLAWSLRPRKWMLAWALILGLIAIFGRPMLLFKYGGGRCEYIDWWFQAHWLPAQGDGAFQGCRFLSTW